jgi:hypothetical protein
VLFDAPYRYLQIPLEDYDNLEGDPLWMRPEYMLEKYFKGTWLKRRDDQTNDEFIEDIKKHLKNKEK